MRLWTVPNAANGEKSGWRARGREIAIDREFGVILET